MIEKYTANQTTLYYEVTSTDYQPYAFAVMFEMDIKMGIASSAGLIPGCSIGSPIRQIKGSLKTSDNPPLPLNNYYTCKCTDLLI